MTAKIICIVLVAVVTVVLMFMADKFLPRDKDKDGGDTRGG